MRSFIVMFVTVLFCASEAKAYEPMDFAFGENGSWMVIYKSGNNRCVAKYGNVLPAVIEELKEVSAEGNSFMGVGLDGKSGWVVISENRSRVHTSVKNVYAPITAKLKEIRAKGWYPKDVALTPEGGYVIIYGQTRYKTNGFVFDGNLPTGLLTVLNGFKKNSGSPVGIGIAPSGGWVIVYTHLNCGKWHLRSGGSLPSRAVKFINEKF